MAHRRQGYGDDDDDATTVWQHDLWSEEWQPIAVGDESSSLRTYGLHDSVPTSKTSVAVPFVCFIA